MTEFEESPVDLRRIAQLGDLSVKNFVLACFLIALAWLLAGTVFGDLASVKMHAPDLLTGKAYLTFGRVRPAHLNSMIYGWASNAMFGVSIWLMARLARTTAKWIFCAWVGLSLWNLGLLAGTVGLFLGISDGMEWLELNRYAADIPMLMGAGLIGASLWRALLSRQVSGLYVSVWYIAASYIWFPIIFFIGNFVSPTGVENAAVNWFYAHNALGLWLTAINLGAIYYFIPKILGRPIYSYWLSLVGFWALAFFYSLNGLHHLIGGPLPSWMITTSIVSSIMMIIPVMAVAVNHHMTMIGRFSALRYSPTLSFVVLGAMAYTGVSLQGIMQALVEINRVTHFTHWTIGHAHMGVYSFVTFTIYGSIYYIAPRLLKREWPSSALIRWHFWLVLSGIFLYISALSIAGVKQGLILNTTTLPFSESVAAALPWLWVRSLAGLLLTIGHLVFVYHFCRLIAKPVASRTTSPWHEISPLVVEPRSLS